MSFVGQFLLFDRPFPRILNLQRGGDSQNFGHGVLTWHLNYLFRTSPGYNLYARGPANWPKDGIVPLEGIIETDWSVATFTMNWKVTVKNQPIDFEPGSFSRMDSGES